MKIEFLTKEIVVSKKFMQEASNYGTDAYNALLQARKDLPEFKIKVKQTRRRKYSYSVA